MVAQAFFGAELNTTGVAARIVAAPAAEGGDAPGEQCSAPPEAEGGYYGGGVALVARGGCSFVHKATLAQAAGASAVLVADLAEGAAAPGCGCGNETQAAAAVHVPVASVGQQDGAALASALARGEAPRVQLALLHVPVIDFSAVVLAAMATAVVLAGALWANADTAKDALARAMCQEDVAHDAQQDELVEVDVRSVISFVGVASALLLVLFFLMSDTFMICIVALFAIGSAVCMQGLLTGFINGLRVAFLGAARRTRGAGSQSEGVTLPMVGRVTAVSGVCAAVSVAISAVWFVYRHEGWAWVLQDLMGVALMVNMLRALRLPNLRVGAVLLTAVLCYDVFWVFISPLLFRGKSVMVQVASGGGARDTLPMLLKCPHIGSPVGGYAMLGFGDVVLPGLMASFALRVDRVKAIKLGGGAPRGLFSGYFVYAMLAYMAGLAATFTALVLMNGAGQPALLYLSPALLGTMVGLAAARGELRALMANDATVLRTQTMAMEAPNTAEDTLADQSHAEDTEAAVDEEAPLIPSRQ